MGWEAEMEAATKEALKTIGEEVTKLPPDQVERAIAFTLIQACRELSLSLEEAGVPPSLIISATQKVGAAMLAGTEQMKQVLSKINAQSNGHEAVIDDDTP